MQSTEIKAFAEKWWEDKELWAFFLSMIDDESADLWFETNYTELSCKTGASIGVIKNWLSVLRKEGAIAVNRVTKQRMRIHRLRFWRDSQGSSTNEAGSKQQ